MVGALGMAGSLVSYEAMAEGAFNTKNLVGKVLSDQEGKRRGEDLLQSQKERISGLLASNRDLVEALRDTLIARDELVGEEILVVVREALNRRKPAEAPAPDEKPAPVIDLTDESAPAPVDD